MFCKIMFPIEVLLSETRVGVINVKICISRVFADGKLSGIAQFAITNVVVLWVHHADAAIADSKNVDLQFRLVDDSYATTPRRLKSAPP